MMHDFMIKTTLPDNESLQRLKSRLQLDPQDRWMHLYSVGHSSANASTYQFTIMDRFVGYIGVKVTGRVEDGRVSGRFRFLLVERLFFLASFVLCFLFAVTFINKGELVSLLDTVIAFFFVAFVYVYRTLRFRDLISGSVAHTLDVKKQVGDPVGDRPLC